MKIDPNDSTLVLEILQCAFLLLFCVCQRPLSPDHLCTHSVSDIVKKQLLLSYSSLHLTRLLSSSAHTPLPCPHPLPCPNSPLHPLSGKALGYMCDTMDPDQVENTVIAHILSAIIDGMRSDRPNEVSLDASCSRCIYQYLP